MFEILDSTSKNICDIAYDNLAMITVKMSTVCHMSYCSKL